MELLETGLRRALPFRTKTEHRTRQQFQATGHSVVSRRNWLPVGGRAGIGRLAFMHASGSGHIAKKKGNAREQKSIGYRTVILHIVCNRNRTGVLKTVNPGNYTQRRSQLPHGQQGLQ